MVFCIGHACCPPTAHPSCLLQVLLAHHHDASSQSLDFTQSVVQHIIHGHALLQVFLTQEHLAISMEFAQGGDLFAYTLGHRPHGRLAETQSRWIFQQLIIGLDYCHRKVGAALNGFSDMTQPGSPRASHAWPARRK